MHVARHAGLLERLPRFVRVRSGALVHLYVREREESLLPEISLDPHIFRVSWEECARSEGQVALAVKECGVRTSRAGEERGGTAKS